MLEIPNTREQFLNDMINHFNYTNRGTNGSGGCLYSTGCAIGRYLEFDLRFKLDEAESSVDYDVVFNVLPDDMKSLGKNFLSLVQHLHDNESYWTNDGLSEFGLDRIEDIVRIEHLDPNLIQYKGESICSK